MQHDLLVCKLTFRMNVFLLRFPSYNAFQIDDSVNVQCISITFVQYINYELKIAAELRMSRISEQNFDMSRSKNCLFVHNSIKSRTLKNYISYISYQNLVNRLLMFTSNQKMRRNVAHWCYHSFELSGILDEE